MAEKIISPGVFTRENDTSFLAQGIGNIGAAIIGPFKKGPTFVPTIVNTQSEFEEIFGTPDGTFYTGYTVQNYLREAGTVTIVRVGHVGGYQHIAPIGISISGSSGNTLIASLLSTDEGGELTGFSGSTISSIASSSDFNITVTGSAPVSSSVLTSSPNDINDVFGNSPKGSKSTYAYNYFENAANTDTDLGTGGIVSLVELPTQEFNYGADTDVNTATNASTPWIQSQLISSTRNNLFRFHTLGDGTNYNKEYKISIYNVKIKDATTSIPEPWPTFSILIRDYNDTDSKQVVKEVYSNVTMNPASSNYILKVIGDKHLTINSSGKITDNGDYDNNSKYVRVEVAPENSFPRVSFPFAHAAYINPINITGTTLTVPAVIFSTGSNENTSTEDTNFAGIDLITTNVKKDNATYLNPIPTSAIVGINTVFSFDDTINAASGGVATPYNFGYEATGSDTTDINKRQFTIGFQNGFDGVTPTRAINLGVSITRNN